MWNRPIRQLVPPVWEHLFPPEALTITRARLHYFQTARRLTALNWNDNAARTALSGLLGGMFAFAWPATNDPAYKSCHAEKPVLIPTGMAHLNINGPTMTPQIVPLQVLKDR